MHNADFCCKKKDKWALNPTAIVHTSNYLNPQSKIKNRKKKRVKHSFLPIYLFYYSIKHKATGTAYIFQKRFINSCFMLALHRFNICARQASTAFPHL